MLCLYKGGNDIDREGDWSETAEKGGARCRKRSPTWGLVNGMGGIEVATGW